MTEHDSKSLVEPGFFSATSAIQLMYGIWVNQVFVGLGLGFGFSAVAIPQITIELHSTTAENAWITSVLTLMSPIGAVICGSLLEKVGRKVCLVLCVVPPAIGWIVTGFAKQPSQLIIGRLLVGLGIGMGPATVRTFCTEMALPDMRGVIGVMMNQAIALGITLQAVFGSLYDWRTISHICSTYTVFQVILNLFLPESPYFVLMKGNVEDTKRCLKRFRAKKYDIEAEIKQMIEYKEKNEIRKLSLKEKIMRLFTPSAYKPFVLVSIYCLAGQLSGITVITFWAVEMLQESNSAIDPYTCNIMFGVTRFLSAFVVSMVIYKIARRSIAIYSSLAIAMLCIFLGIFMLKVETPSVIPLITFMAYIAASTFGYYTIPALILFELIPLEIRGFLGGITLSMLNLMIFCANTLFPYAKKQLGFPQTIILFGCASFTCAIYLCFYLPETKGLTLQETENIYKEKT